MKHHNDPGQIDLFAEEFAASGTTSETPVRQFENAGNPRLLPEVLYGIWVGWYGQLDLSGRIVRFGQDGHCRHADDDITTVIESLLDQRYARPGDAISVLHGVIRKNAVVLKLTPGGDRLRLRPLALVRTR